MLDTLERRVIVFEEVSVIGGELVYLWPHCAHHGSDSHATAGVGIAPKRQRGAQSNWDEEARKRVWLIAESCVKNLNSPYREVYDKIRAKYAEAVHEAPWRCGPKGKPAAIGTPISAGHQHARAMRAMSKEILRDLWREARRLHGVDE